MVRRGHRSRSRGGSSRNRSRSTGGKSRSRSGTKYGGRGKSRSRSGSKSRSRSESRRRHRRGGDEGTDSVMFNIPELDELTLNDKEEIPKMTTDHQPTGSAEFTGYCMSCKKKNTPIVEEIGRQKLPNGNIMIKGKDKFGHKLNTIISGKKK